MKRKHTLTGGAIGFLLTLFALGSNASTLVVISNVTATASSSRTPNESGPPSVAVDGTGLVGDAHGIDTTHLWKSAVKIEDGVSWFRADLNDIYNLRRIWVWNYNSSSTLWTTRRSTRTVNIYVSTTDPGATAPGAGAPWALVHENYYFNAGPGTTGYLPNTFVEMNGVEARYVGFEILKTHDNSDGYRPGLSELRFYYEAPSSGTLLLIQ